MTYGSRILVAWAALTIGSLAAGSAEAAIMTWLPTDASTPHHWSSETGSPTEPQASAGKRRLHMISLAQTSAHRPAQRAMGGLSKSRLTVNDVPANSGGGASLPRARSGAAGTNWHLSGRYALATRPLHPLAGSAGSHPGSAPGLGDLIGTQINNSLGGIGDGHMALPPVSQPGSDNSLVSGPGHNSVGSGLTGDTSPMGSYPPGAVFGANGPGIPTIPPSAISLLPAILTQPSADSVTANEPLANPEPASALIWLGVSAMAAFFAARSRRNV